MLLAGHYVSFTQSVPLLCALLAGAIYGHSDFSLL